MSFHKDINDFLSNKLNSNAFSLPYELYHRYDVGDTDFSKLMLESSYDESDSDAEDNVVVSFNGVETNTPNGVYTLRHVSYIPCIIEDFIGDCEPIKEVKIASYSIPITFFVDGEFNKANSNVVDNSLEEFQDSLRGLTQSLNGVKILFNHSDVRPISELIEFNGIHYRSYQIVVYVETLSSGYFGNEIKYWIKGSDIGGAYTSLTEIFPISRGSQRGNETVSIQKFKTASNNGIEVKSIPDMSAFGLSFSILYEDNELSRHFVTQRYTPNPLSKYQIKIVYPNLETTPFLDDYIIDEISGPENLGEKIIINVSFKRVSDVV